MSFLQQANAAHIEYETGPKLDWRDLGTTGDERGDAAVLLDRFFMYPHGVQSWDHLTSCWLPFVQVSRDDRKSWSKRRVKKALDQLETAGLIVALDDIGSKYRITDEARRNFGSTCRTAKQ